MHPSVYQADFFELPVVDAKDAAGAEPQEGPQRFTVDDDGDLVSLTAGSFDCAVLSLVLSYVPDPQKRIEMVSKIRRCLGDERSLFFLVEVGSALATARWYKGDAVYEWGRAIEKAGFKLLVYEDTVTDRGKKPFEVHQWVFETVPVKPDVKLEPLLSPRDMW